MPLNKNASFRYRIINKCLIAHRNGISKEDLINEISLALNEEFGIDKPISERTFYSDIQIMRSAPPRGFDAPIICKDSLYKYSNPDYDIFQHDLSNKDLEAIEQAFSILKQFGFSEATHSLQSLLYKIKASSRINPDPFLYVDTNTQLKGLEYLSYLYNACRENIILQIEYQAFQEEKKTLIVEPYMLREFNNRWYLIAKTADFEDAINLALDRIQKIDETNNFFVRDDNIDLHQRYDEIFGITYEKSQPIEKIIFRLNKLRAPYLETKPLHKTQKIRKKTKAFTEFELNLRINKELLSELLYFGADLKIIKPNSLREDINDLHQAAYLINS
jgi:predicted DNA-binding transcriptional regulator YafY